MSKKTLAYVIYPGVSLLELVGNRTVLGGIMERKAGYQAVVVGARMEAIATDTPLSIIPVPATYLIRLLLVLSEAISHQHAGGLNFFSTSQRRRFEERVDTAPI